LNKSQHLTSISTLLKFLKMDLINRVIDKEAELILPDQIKRYYFFKSGSFEKLWITAGNLCLVEPNSFQYYVLNESELIENTKNSRRRGGYPVFEATESTLFEGIPNKWSNNSFALFNFGRGIDFQPYFVAKSGEIAFNRTDAIMNKKAMQLDLKELLPTEIKMGFSDILAHNIISAGDNNKLYVFASREFKNVIERQVNGKLREIYSEKFICVFNNKGKYVGLIDSIPQDLVYETSIAGTENQYATSPQHQLHYLHTTGNTDNLSNCKSYVTRWH